MHGITAMFLGNYFLLKQAVNNLCTLEYTCIVVFIAKAAK